MENDLTIKVSEIEKTLVDLFEKEKQSNTVRASLFNLVIYTQDTDRVPYLTHLIKSLIKKFPCRILFIKESDSKEDLLNTSVSALKPEGNDDGFFCEHIHFEVSPSTRERISYLVTPHIIPNLPVYTVFAADPTKDVSPTTLKLDSLSTRVIFDSEYMEHMSKFSSYITSLHNEETDIGDLNWARFSSWRSVFANVFSNKQKQKILASADEITIKYNPRSTTSFHHTKIQATYLQGWIATNMYWSFESVLCEGEKIAVSYTSNQGRHKFYLEQAEQVEGMPPGCLLSVEIKNDRETTSFIREGGSDHLIKICHCSPDICELPVLFPLTNEGTAKAISREIYLRDTSPDFLACLKLLSHWKSGIICS